MAQPNPKPGKEDVTPVARAEFLRMLAEREAQGIATYGTTLQTHNGRDMLQDAKEEAVDLIQYLIGAEMEREDLRRELAEVKAEVQLGRIFLQLSHDDKTALEEIRRLQQQLAEFLEIVKAVRAHCRECGNPVESGECTFVGPCSIKSVRVKVAGLLPEEESNGKQL
jgi:predicted Zn-ribbon and HTH transcriptional regulator